MEKSNNDSPNEEFVCDICGESFDALSDFEEHKRHHSRPGLGLANEEREQRGDIGAAGLPTSPFR